MNQKIDNQLNLSLMLTEAERSLGGDLNTGYNRFNNEWELIIRYTGDIVTALSTIPATIKELSYGYGLVKVKQSDIDRLSALREVIFVEKPRKLYTALDYSTTAACVNQVGRPPFELTGKGILVAVIDTGIDYTHPDFRNEDGTTRFAGIYDENTQREYSKEEINEALSTGIRLPIEDFSGHGTHVTGIAAGNGRAANGRYRGVAYESDILAVILGRDDFFNTARLMEGVDYSIKFAERINQPIAVNLSIGNNYGAHDGNSLLENYLNAVAGSFKTVIVTGTGNEANKGIHNSGIVEENLTVELIIGENEATVDVQLWKKYEDDFIIYIRTPGGIRLGPIQPGIAVSRYDYNNTKVFIYYGEPKPYTGAQEILFQFIPNEDFIDEGIWEFEFVPRKIVTGEYDMWLPSGSFISTDTGFLINSPEATLTIPSTSYNVISVGAYDARNNSYGAFSGRGFTRRIRTIKPDMVAPGVGIRSTAPGGGYANRTGTSMAAPFVTGSAALLMEWGIVRGNDPFMYGEKVKAVLVKGARALPGEEVPSEKTGWGRLCLEGSLSNI